MSEQDRIAFEKWLKQNYPDYPPPLSEVWQAATAEANKRIEALVRMNVSLAKENAELQANNHDLREALENINKCCIARGGDEYIQNIICEALSASPAESLQAHDDMKGK